MICMIIKYIDIILYRQKYIEKHVQAVHTHIELTLAQTIKYLINNRFNNLSSTNGK